MFSEVCTDANWCGFSVRAASDLSGSGIFRQQGRCAYQQQADFFAVPDPGDTICPGCLQPYADLLLHRLEYAQHRRKCAGLSAPPAQQGRPLGHRKPPDRERAGIAQRLCAACQLFCQEEFLRRLEKSKYADNFVLKGGLFVYAVTEFDSRVTVDVDFLLRKVPNAPEQVKAVLEEIIAVPSENDYVTFEIKDVAPIAVTKKYAGVGATVVARIKNTRTPFGIDFGIGDVIVPKQEKRKIPIQLEGFDAPMVNTYSLETTIAEKLDAILNLMEFSTRMKDYYDIYYLANKFDFDGVVLTEALGKTFTNRTHTFTAARFEQIVGFDSDDAMQKKWRAFCRKTDIRTDDYSAVLKTIKAFLEKPFTAAVENSNFDGKWSVVNNAWECK